MTGREELRNEVGGFVVLLRQHAELRYRRNGSEYESKRRVAIEGVTEAISRATDVALPVDYEDTPIDDLKDAELPSVRRLVKRTVANQRRRLASLPAQSPAAEACRDALRRWERALSSL